MGSEGNGDVFQQRNNLPISSIANKVVGMVMSANGIDPFSNSGWDPVVSMNLTRNFENSSMVSQNEFDNPHYSVLLENQMMGSSCSSHLVQFPSDQSLVNMLPQIPSSGNGSFSEMVSEYGHIAESRIGANFALNNGVGIRGATANTTNSQENCRDSGDGVLRASPYGKRKRSGGASPKNTEEEKMEDTSRKISEFREQDDEKKQKSGRNVVGAEASKENYIHLRAKKGQATNSHSLAERVRREKISERMKLLQELVPGCNKITGKAVMLDEIINYVQSLQNQVEFLSMKLATVNPELNVDVEPILSKDILHSQGNNTTAHGNHLALSSSYPSPGCSQGIFDSAPSRNISPLHSLPHNLWNNDELQRVLQMGFATDNSIRSLGPNGN